MDECGAELAADLVLLVTGRGACRSEDGDGAGHLGERTEAFDELALDPQYTPRIGVHPVGRAAAIEQPLVHRRRLAGERATQLHRALVHDLAPGAAFGGGVVAGHGGHVIG